MKKNKNLWDHYYKGINTDLKISDMSLYEYMIKTSKKYQDNVVIDYFGKKINYKDFFRYVDVCANALKSLGVRTDDVVTIAMPNTPEAVISFLAINKIGAISNMVHPLSSEEEIKSYLNETKSTLFIMYNDLYSKVKNIIKDTQVYKVIVCSLSDSMPIHLNTIYKVTKERKQEKPLKSSLYIFWHSFIKMGLSFELDSFQKKSKDDAAVILHSGGTTGIPKSIVLSNNSFINIVLQSKICFNKVKSGDSMLSILPMFHCFGLIVCIYVPICLGMKMILLPSFDAKKFGNILLKYKPSVISGVPTLYEALLRIENLEEDSLKDVKYLLSGGDTLPIEKNKEINDFLKKHGCKEEIIQGYGMSETSGPVTFGSLGSNKLGSIGIPFPGNIVKIINPKTLKEEEINTEGEICIYSKSLMKYYLNNKKATDNVFIKLSDGLQYLKTGDLGYLDKDGVLFYVARLKRIIVSSGYNVYPEYIEKTLTELDFIKEAFVVGIPHPYKKEIGICFIVLKDNVTLSYTLRKNIMDYAKKNLSYYMIPKEYIFKEELPKTKLGKIDYNKLLEEAMKKRY